jgi:Uma2 family endonuclease
MSTVAHISVEQYEIMIEHGVFDGKHRQRVELIRGEIRQMNPIGIEHENAVDFFTEWSILALPRKAVRVRIQETVLLPNSDSAPQPDIVWARRKRYTRHPLPEDIFLVIEVADSSLAGDRGEKANLYAEANIADYWIVNLNDECIEVLRNPLEGEYRDKRVCRGDDEIAPLSFPDVKFKPSLLLDEV